MRVLISGAGIAGPTLAYWLLRHGFEPTLVEKAPALRTGGYVIDFWGSGFDVAERMSLVAELREKAYRLREVRMVDARGRRGDLATSLYRTVENRVETLFGEGIAGLERRERDLQVTFDRSAPRPFDLVVGADGLHSRVRELAFGPQERFERYLGYKVAAFQASGYRPRDPDVYVMYNGVGRQVARFSMRDDRTLFLFVLADADRRAGGDDVDEQKAFLRRRFHTSGWECAQILEVMGSACHFYFDQVSQVRIDRWTRGRIALVGDAAFCPSLLAGQGSALAMAAAYVLAGELKSAGGQHEEAFARYQERLGALILRKQRAAARFAGFFAPRSRFGLFVRNQLSKLLSIRAVANLSLGRGLSDRISLPEVLANARAHRSW